MIFSHSQITGSLAMWAVRQSPYDVPDKLAEAIEGFSKALPLVRMAPPMQQFYEIQEEDTLYRAISKAVHAVPAILAWNERKNGRDAPFNFVSRVDPPRDPDDDFIDLGALARNASLSVWREGERDKAFDEDFDRRWNSWSLRWGRFIDRMRQRLASP